LSLSFASIGETPAKQPLAVWLNLEAGDRETEDRDAHRSIEVSSKAGEGRSVWFDEKARR